ncbi:hypothetical protein KVR01_010605 [Diaporthe batatas]|uniref:uncharacterized protein n=1 Tax=Diaporthe batatas TaxID=748121 RepID=UPI001D05B958|nr:uncharacterized protein KVR01_010605 [Diaporthe batatas]KAG8159968.1 hypothetical protein KVR01_010605 [Diaporthe batatas]
MAEFDWNAAVIHPKQNYYRRYRVTSWPASMMAWGHGHGIVRRPAKVKHATTHQIRGGAQDLSRAPAPQLIGHGAPGTDTSPRWMSRKLEHARATAQRTPFTFHGAPAQRGHIHQRAVPSWPSTADPRRTGQTALSPDRTRSGGGRVACWPAGQWPMVSGPLLLDQSLQRSTAQGRYPWRDDPSAQPCTVDDCFPSVRPSRPSARASFGQAIGQAIAQAGSTGGSDPRKSFHLHCKDVAARFKPPACCPRAEGRRYCETTRPMN